VPSARIIREMWGSQRASSPEGALKTMVSRLRGMLADIDPRLGACIRSAQGAYLWETQDGVSVDVLDVIDLHDEWKRENDEARRVDLCRRLIRRYQGDLYQTGDLINASTAVSQLHRIYLDTVLALIEYLKQQEAFNEIVEVCERAIRIDDMDESIHLEQMRAMVNLNRTADALREYQRVTRRDRRQLDAEPSDDMKAWYAQMSRTGAALRMNLDVIRNELSLRMAERSGPFVCDYPAFREIYHIQMRNLERLGSTMFLGLIMLGDGERRELDSVRRESAMAGLMETLRENLRRGDIITRYAPNVVALLLPTVNYTSGSMVMERIEHLFYQNNPRDEVTFHARISPLGGGLEASRPGA